ncbi:MAG: sulfite exporter TauE/SafE family protein [Armatimonadetes bacterium]|jgi:uncharacterized membrane protein YfcA|nr:sulfite exporter TauE/SafE family protein [Armatimonadota bacterium]
MNLELWQWIIGLSAALFVGISKTGIPGIGIVAVPLLALGFGGRLSAGVMLPMLIMGDIFAVAWYRRHARWDKLVELLPWVYLGVAIGTVTLWKTGHSKSLKDPTDVIIGAIVLVMLILHLLRSRLSKQLQPTSPAGVGGTGIAAGFATTVSNAAGPVMQMYMAAHKLSKEAFMGTIAWYFFIINFSKLPIYWILSAMIPQKPIVTADSLLFNLEIAPAIILGAFLGKWLLPRIKQQSFESIVIILAAIGALNLIFGATLVKRLHSNPPTKQTQSASVAAYRPASFEGAKPLPAAPRRTRSL